MAAVIAARFDSFAAANSAAHALFAYGIDPDAVNVFFAPEACEKAAPQDIDADPATFAGRFQAQVYVAALATLCAVAGGAIVMTFGGTALFTAGAGALGAFIGAWTGALWLASRGRSLREEQRRRYALLTAQVLVSQEQEAIELLLDAGSLAVERAQGRWVNGQWLQPEPTAARLGPQRSARPGVPAFRARDGLLG